MFSSQKYDIKFRFFFTYLVDDIVRCHICHLHTLLAVCARPAMSINRPFDYLFNSVFDHPKAIEGKSEAFLFTVDYTSMLLVAILNLLQN
jgi:hypothetical protein